LYAKLVEPLVVRSSNRSWWDRRTARGELVEPLVVSSSNRSWWARRTARG